MDKIMEGHLSSYINSQSRNKIVFYRNDPQDFTSIDLGFTLAQRIYNLNDLEKLPMKVSNELDELLSKSVFNHSRFGNILAIANIGILFEPELKQDLKRILENNSISNTLFVKWEGEIDNDNLYFLTKEKGIKTNIKHLSHIVI